MATVSVRYIVADVDAAIAFYGGQLGFHVEVHPGPGFAMLSHGALRLLLSTPGGWNRIQLEVDDLNREVEKLRAAGVRFRNEIVVGNGGRQILLDDPAGNPIELFEPARRGPR